MKIAISTTVGCMIFVSAFPAFAQSALNSTASTGEQRQVNAWRDVAVKANSAKKTNKQVGSRNGPHLWGTPSRFGGPWGQSGAASSAPFQGTYVAPANLAARQIGLIVLPPTQMTSIVRDSGMNDAIYGDEGTDDIPPYDGFDESHRIINGMSPTLTTGHPSDAPSAWGYPQ